MNLSLVAAAAAIVSAFAGFGITGSRVGAQRLVPFGGGLLVGVGLFGLLPELASEVGWGLGLGLFLAGYTILFLVDRHVYPVCPSCSHDHDHGSCARALHGFAGPLVAATALHAFLDGWSIGAAQSAGSGLLGVSVPAAVVLHKIPEGVALGAILRAAMEGRAAAMSGVIAAELATVLGALVATGAAPHVGAQWLQYPLAMAGGCFFYLGAHAVHGEWRRRGGWNALVPALTGAAGAAALQQGARVLFR